MDTQSIRNYLIPALALAAVIVVIALIVAGNDSPPRPASSGSDTSDPSRPLIAPGADTSDAGMSDAMPPIDGPGWIAYGPDGLKVMDVKEGTGDTIGAGATVAMHYTGWLASNGKQFDSSRTRGEPLKYPLTKLIRGWQDGIPGMKIGGIRRLYIPGALAYPQGTNGIPPMADLVFEVKLLGFQ